MNLSPGAHLRVRRAWGYWHHGIYVSNDRVIQFGGRIMDKPKATVEAVSLKDFARRACVKVVFHRPGKRLFGPVGPPGIPEEIIHRAEWLLARHPVGRYNLIGWNCETAATFCVNGFRESSQVRHFIGILGLTGMAFTAVTLFFKTPPKWFRLPTWTYFAITIPTYWAYRHYSNKIWLDLEDQWNADH